VGASERLVLFPTWLLLDLLGVVMLSTFGYEQPETLDLYPLEENEANVEQHREILKIVRA